MVKPSVMPARTMRLSNNPAIIAEPWELQGERAEGSLHANAALFREASIAMQWVRGDLRPCDQAFRQPAPRRLPRLAINPRLLR